MACPASNTDARNRLSNAATPLSQVHDLLVSLLHWWPYSPHQQCPSILLCGPTSNGKSYLMRRVVHDANIAVQCSSTAQEMVAHDSRRRIIAVTPRLAQAAAVQNAKDGCTGLRRLLRSAIEDACTNSVSNMAEGNKVNHGEPVEVAVLLVLDHVECYLTHDEESFLGNGDAVNSSASAVQRIGEDAAFIACASGGLNTPYPALLADFYTVLRSAPPLFSQSECTTLRLSTLVSVLLFTGELDEVQPTVRQHFVDYALSLPTPTEAERRAFFQPYTKPTEAGVGLLPVLLVDALVLRTGGVSYGGLKELVTLALDYIEDPVNASPLDTYAAALPRSRLTTTQWDAQAAGAAAQTILHTYQTSGSVTALEYRASAGYVDVQVTRWDDIAGMSDVKATLRRLVTDPIHHRNVYRRFHVRPSTGVLLYGPPGTGKTMLAKAMATELNASFIYMDLPELMQSEVGESERRLQAYFDVARERSPSLVFMDEVQAAFGARYSDTAGKGDKRNQRFSALLGDSDVGKSMTATSHDARLVSHLLRMLDAAQQDEDHFILFVGATNAVQLLEPLLLRAGRLDTLLEVPLPDTAAREILVKRVVYGEWSGWFHRRSGADMLLSSGVGARQMDRIQAALTEEFVRLSDGFSGAQVRNFLSVFGLQLARTVNRDSWTDGEVLSLHREDDNVGAAEMRDEVAQRRGNLQEVITHFLAGDDAGKVLSRAAQELINVSHAKTLA